METNDRNDAMPVNEAAKFTGLSISTLNKLRCAGGGPTFLKLGRAVRYRRDDLEFWLASRVARSTSDADVRLPKSLATARQV